LVGRRARTRFSLGSDFWPAVDSTIAIDAAQALLHLGVGVRERPVGGAQHHALDARAATHLAAEQRHRRAQRLAHPALLGGHVELPARRLFAHGEPQRFPRSLGAQEQTLLLAGQTFFCRLDLGGETGHDAEPGAADALRQVASPPDSRAIR
jgi:hypothetical protein